MGVGSSSSIIINATNEIRLSNSIKNDEGPTATFISVTGEKGGRSGELTLNGAAARKVAVGDVLILITYAWMEVEEARNFNPALVFPNEETNQLN